MSFRVKITKKQQDVLDLMDMGWKLHRFVSNSWRLVKTPNNMRSPTMIRTVSPNTARALRRRRLIEPVRKPITEWKRTSLSSLLTENEALRGIIEGMSTKDRVAGPSHLQFWIRQRDTVKLVRVEADGGNDELVAAAISEWKKYQP